jgi:hypothetical protein
MRSRHLDATLMCLLDLTTSQRSRPRAVRKSYVEEFLERTAAMEQKGNEFEKKNKQKINW